MGPGLATPLVRGLVWWMKCVSISCTKLMSLSVASVGGDESDEYDEPFEEPKCMYTVCLHRYHSYIMPCG